LLLFPRAYPTLKQYRTSARGAQGQRQDKIKRKQKTEKKARGMRQIKHSFQTYSANILDKIMSAHSPQVEAGTLLQHEIMAATDLRK
jgi:hypothetical protein